jgi:molecular chaperone Hsp33
MDPVPGPTDRWIKIISTQGNIRGVAVHATGLVQEMATQHGLEGLGAQGLGETVMGALLLAATCKPGERMNLNIQGSGRYRQALADAHPDGTVRGFVMERENTPEEIKSFDKLGIGPWGAGTLSVLRTKSDETKRQPYIGTVPLLTGYLAKDLSFYWVQSEQIPSAVGLAVNLADDGKKVTTAGGFLIQALPGASVEEVRAIENHINELQSMAEALAKDDDPLHLLSRIFQSTGFMILEEKPISFKCQCSWERVERALTLVGPAELKAMLAEDGEAIVKCDFCCKEYKVRGPDLERLIKSAAGPS